MDQFAAERYRQKLCIRYVSGLRNEKLFYVNEFRFPATILIGKNGAPTASRGSGSGLRHEVLLLFVILSVALHESRTGTL